MLSILLLMLGVTQARADETTVPRSGLVINRSCRIAHGVYALPSNDETNRSAAVTIRGNDLTVDFSGVELQGTPPETQPDQRKGVGILVDGRNITLKNLHVQGYKIGLLARNCPGLKLLGGDLSYNWKQHLLSTPDREDESDWMSYHHNENDEWLRYGAAVYLRDCDRFEVRGVTIHGGQCGLMLVQCNHGLVWNNDFSFLSGIGVGLYRSSDNRIMHNRIDWCVRGYSDGVYSRGQDSAGILCFEQCNSNIVAYNSVTHGGDGFFLWAGQTTMDSGQGGCNDNLLYGNDFSYAPTNGIEATFSRNRFVNNRVEGCDYGVWGGYSYDTLVLGNRFAANNHGIAIEHGQHNKIVGNRFYQDDVTIALWQNAGQDPNWGYPRHHDTVSHDYTITGNVFLHARHATLSLRDTRDVRFESNRIVADAPALQLTGDTNGFVSRNNSLQGKPQDLEKLSIEPGAVVPPITATLPSASLETPWTPLLQRSAIGGETQDALYAEMARMQPAPLHGGAMPFHLPQQQLDRRYIIIDAWGPYDFQSPRLQLIRSSGDVNGKEAIAKSNSVALQTGKKISQEIPKDATKEETTRLNFELLGPPGRWRVKALQGIASLSVQTGVVPGKLEVTLTPGKAGEARIDLEYVGVQTRDYRGVVTPKGVPVVFGYSKFFTSIDWNVRFFTYNAANDPRSQPDAFARLVATGMPVATLQTRRLDFSGYNGFAPGVPGSNFATIADSDIDFPQGNYVLEALTDDGCRVSVDGKLVIDAWKYQGPTLYTAPVKLNGKHHLHVEHFQIDGYAALKIDVKPAH